MPCGTGEEARYLAVPATTLTPWAHGYWRHLTGGGILRVLPLAAGLRHASEPGMAWPCRPGLLKAAKGPAPCHPRASSDHGPLTAIRWFTGYQTACSARRRPPGRTPIPVAASRRSESVAMVGWSQCVMAYRLALMVIAGQAGRFGSAGVGMTGTRESCVAFRRAGRPA